MKKVLLFVFASTLLLISCRNNTTINTIHVDVHSTAVPNVKISRVVPLETCDSSLFSEIATIEVYKNRFYILDRDNAMALFLFDSTGQLLNRTRYGKAPSEMLCPYDFYIDTIKRQILVWDQDKDKMNYFDYNLNFDSDTAIDMLLKDFTRLNTGEWLVCAEDKDVYGKSVCGMTELYYYYFVYSHDFTRIIKMMLPIPNSEFRSISFSSSIAKLPNPLFYTKYDMNIYSLDDNNNLRVEYKVDFGKYNPKSNLVDQPMEDIFRLQCSGFLVSAIDNLLMGDKLLSFEFPFKEEMLYSIYSKQLRKAYISSAIERNGLLPRGSVKAITAEGELVLVADAADYVEFCEAKGQPTTVKPTDNPVLVMFTIDE